MLQEWYHLHLISQSKVSAIPFSSQPSLFSWHTHKHSLLQLRQHQSGLPARICSRFQPRQTWWHQHFEVEHQELNRWRLGVGSGRWGKKVGEPQCVQAKLRVRMTNTMIHTAGMFVYVYTDVAMQLFQEFQRQTRPDILNCPSWPVHLCPLSTHHPRWSCVSLKAHWVVLVQLSSQPSLEIGNWCKDTV